MANNFEHQAIEAAKNLVEILKKQVDSEISASAREQKQDLIVKIRELYNFTEQ